MIIGINHVQVTIPKGAEVQARQFYGVILGLTELEKPESLKKNGGLWFALGNLQVHLGCEDNAHRQQSKAHIAYQVSDIQWWRSRFAQYGVPVKENIPVPGFDRFDIRDPFGNRLEFMQAVQ
ncbi:VOC family protein [Veronia pacifica]|uniref:Glyoxalase n=1 Tax=Veronia pacifica TaxID=1080227 RepID=A0A1C3ECI5_9GAMM|nr:VOC family protein [Veronia pacifica]ODA30920.1 glyoxalase [Veronia pacifica]